MAGGPYVMRESQKCMWSCVWVWGQCRVRRRLKLNSEAHQPLIGEEGRAI